MSTAVAVCDISSFMYEIDGIGGKQNPARVKRTRRVFPRSICKASSARAEMLWCGELVRVLSRAIAVFDNFARTLPKKVCKFGFYCKGCRCDCARLVLRPGPENPSHLRNRMRLVRDGRTALDSYCCSRIPGIRMGDSPPAFPALSSV